MNCVLTKKYNLPFTHMIVWNNGMSVILENVLVDTGSSSTILKLARVDEIDLVAKEEDAFGFISGVGVRNSYFIKLLRPSSWTGYVLKILKRISGI